jgi:hypothetical protein
MSDDFKETVFQKKSDGGLFHGLGRTIYNLNFSVIVLKKISVNMENLLNGEKRVLKFRLKKNVRFSLSIRDTVGLIFKPKTHLTLRPL